MIRIIFFCIISILATTLTTMAQEYSDTISCEVGVESYKLVQFTDNQTSGPRSLSGKIIISNPTVFYIDSLQLISQAGITHNAALTRIHDTLYSFSVEDNSSACSDCNMFALYGTPLAGNDTVCVVTFSDLIYNGTQTTPFIILIKSDPLITPLPYLKAVKMQENYPNPATPAGPTYWRYRIDRATDIIFNLWNMQGCLIAQFKDFKDKPGYYTYRMEIAPEYSSGMYYFEIITNTGRDSKKFIIIR